MADIATTTRSYEYLVTPGACLTYGTAVSATYEKESNGMKTITFTVDDKQYSIQQEKSVISIGRIVEVAGVESGDLKYFDKDGELCDASDYYQAGKIPAFFSEEYLSD